MRTIKVSNLMIQFDTECTDSENLEIVQEMIDEINQVLSERFNDEAPQIFTTAISNSDIEVVNTSVNDEDYHEHICPECSSPDVENFFDPDKSITGENTGRCRDCGYVSSIMNF